MSKSSLVRKAGACWAVLSLLSLTSLAQSGYNTNGGPYALVGSLAGDQAHPAMSLTPSGGYMVWEDNTIDGSGLGIRAAVLDSSLSMVGFPFRVNQRTGADQERPQVAALPNGGAAFFWQGGLQGYQHIFGRFISSSNVWLGPDVVVSSPTNHFQVEPAATGLSNGNVVVVWGSYNQYSSSSMQDVYGQIFAPDGTKVGSEFLVNQFTSYNQRTPGIAPLANGGFVVVWVSEQQRVQVVSSSNMLSSVSFPSTDIYGRIFNASGSPSTSEFLVNSNADACANPRAAAGTDGGFIVVWSAKDSVTADNSWDIFARPFASASATSGGAIARVNTTVYGDQFAPQISSVGTDYFAVWKSLGPQRVNGQFLKADGTLSGGELTVSQNPAIKLAGPALSSDNNNQFLVVWPRFVGFVYGIDLYAQRYAGPNTGTSPGLADYEPPASDPFAIDPTMPTRPALPPQLGGGNPLNPPTNPTSSGSLKGIYAGLFYDTNGVSADTAGSFTAAVTDRGAYSARLTLGKRTYAITGKLDGSNSTTKVINRGGGLTSLTVQFQISGDQVTGTVSNRSWLAEIFAYRQQAPAKAAPAFAHAGKYTMIVPPDETSAGGPGGYSFGTIVVDAQGNVRWAGTLADGTKATQKSSLSSQGIWPLYASLYGGMGSIMSWVQFSPQGSTDLAGQAVWVKPAHAPGKNYAAGFTNSVLASGSAYTPPVRSRALNLPTGELVCSGAGVSTTNSIAIDSKGKVSYLDGPKLNLAIAPSSGLFHGTVVNPATRRNVPFQGVVLQDSTNGFGYYLNSGQSGSVSITAP